MRLYNGCPDDELAAIWKSRADAKAEARKLGYGICWYPVEEKYAAYNLETYEGVGPFMSSVEQCYSYVRSLNNASDNQ